MKLACNKSGIAILSLILLLTLLLLQKFVEPSLLQAHTPYVLAQLDEAYHNSLLSGHKRIKNSEQFIELVPQWKIDWESCGFRDNAILDSWGVPLKVQVDATHIILSSSGLDRIFGTEDDILREITR